MRHFSWKARAHPHHACKQQQQPPCSPCQRTRTSPSALPSLAPRPRSVSTRISLGECRAQLAVGRCLMQTRATPRCRPHHSARSHPTACSWCAPGKQATRTRHTHAHARERDAHARAVSRGRYSPRAHAATHVQPRASFLSVGPREITSRGARSLKLQRSCGFAPREASLSNCARCCGRDRWTLAFTHLPPWPCCEQRAPPCLLACHVALALKLQPPLARTADRCRAQDRASTALSMQAEKSDTCMTM